MKNEIEKAMDEISPEELGFEIHPRCKICNNTYKLEIDKMILEGVNPKRIAEFCMLPDPYTGKQRVVGSLETLQRNIARHKKHIPINKTAIEEVQQKSMVLYKAKVKENVSLEEAKKLATQRMVDQLADDNMDFEMSDLAVPINLEQKERSVKVEEGSLQINFAKFIKSDKNEQIPGNEIKSIEDSIRGINERISNIGREIRSIEGDSGKD